MLKRILKGKRGEGYIDVAVGILCLLLVVAFAVQLFPVFTAKQQLDIFAVEIVREAEIKGSTNVDSRIADMREQTGLNPTIRWDCDYYSGKKIQLNGDIEVLLTDTVDIGFFVFGSFPIEIQAKATGKSEVYYK
ncbi:MAG: DUF4320 family protein [Oscillospiraceae bacterium]|jgi:hypothetical protein|nr:DUF4320 family protein [Oscillospiraceae bacterium]MEA4969216.1 DUF4320 family protein [Candidatus Pelethousia sp.]